MKKRIIIITSILLIFAAIVIAKTWQEYDIYTTPADDDYFMLQDTSDPADPDGILKRLAWLYVQPRDSDLTSVAALSTTAAGRNLLTLAQMSNGQLIIGNGTSTPALATIAETGDALTIANAAGAITFSAHANVEAVADAETGVASPGITMYDSDTGTNNGTAFIYGTSVGAATNKAVTMQIGVEESGGSNANYIEIDGVNGTVDVQKPIHVEYANSGNKMQIDTASVNLQSTDPNAYRKVYVVSVAAGANVTYTLQNDPQQDATNGYTRDFTFSNYSASYTMILQPGSGDAIKLVGDSASCGTDTSVTCVANKTATIRLIGRNASNWLGIPYNNQIDCDCTP